MRQRPIACAAFLLFLILLLMPAEFFYRTPQLTEKCKAEVLGYVERRTWKNEKMQLLLEDCQIRTGEDEFQEDRLLVYTKDPTEYEVGSYFYCLFLNDNYSFLYHLNLYIAFYKIYHYLIF